MRSRAGFFVPVLASLLLSACVSSVASSDGMAAPSRSAGPLPTDTPSTLAPTFTPAAPSSTPTVSTPQPSLLGDSFVGTVVTTLADDGLRVRSEPEISDDSFMLEPLLPYATKLYVLDGPVRASGYDWYEAAPLSSADLPTGWIASVGRDGTPWVARSRFDCPPVPSTMRSLARLPRAVGVVCFPRVPITVDARLLSCECDMDGSWYDPSWFFLGSGSPNLLVDPETRDVPSDVGRWFALNLDPAGEYPGALPVGQIVRATGIFDHPAAVGCTRTEMDGKLVATQGCRLEFAVTRLVVVGP